MVSKSVHPGVSFRVVYAIDPTLWPSRGRFAGIPGRRGASWENFRRFGHHFGVEKWTQSGPRGFKKWDFEVGKYFSIDFFGVVKFKRQIPTHFIRT